MLIRAERIGWLESGQLTEAAPVEDRADRFVAFLYYFAIRLCAPICILLAEAIILRY